MLKSYKKSANNVAICKNFRKYVTFYSNCDIIYFKVKFIKATPHRDCAADAQSDFSSVYGVLYCMKNDKGRKSSWRTTIWRTIMRQDPERK